MLEKYGHAQYDYFTDSSCSKKNPKVTRTKEGLFCHHIDENKAILLCEDNHARENPFEYQKKDRLVYCNFLEHFLLHVLIVEENMGENLELGIGGALTISHQLNDFYSGYEYKRQWLIDTTSVVKNDYSTYIKMLKRLFFDVQFKYFYNADDFSKGWDGTVYPKIKAEILKVKD